MWVLGVFFIREGCGLYNLETHLWALKMFFTCKMENRLESQTESPYLQWFSFFDTCVNTLDSFPILLLEDTVIKDVQTWSLKNKTIVHLWSAITTVSSELCKQLINTGCLKHTAQYTQTWSLKNKTIYTVQLWSAIKKVSSELCKRLINTGCLEHTAQ